MPLPTQDEIETLRGRIRNAIDANIPEVLGADAEGAPILGEDGRETLVRLYESPTAAAEFEMWARGHARTAGWERARIREGLNFRPFKQEYEQRAQARRQQVAQARSALRVVGGRDVRRNGHDPADYTGEMTPEQMTESDSLFLIAVGTLLQRRAGRIWFDTFHKKYFANWAGGSSDAVLGRPRARDDVFDLAVYAWLQQVDHRLGKLSLTMCAAAISYVADRDHRNEARDWLTSLEWDGCERLHAVMSEAFKAGDDDYTRAVGRCWFVSMAARIMEPGCKVDTMPVFMGAQGRQKSQALEIVGGDWYRAASSSIDSANFLQELQGCLIFEIPEMHSIIATRHGSAKVKAVLSTRIDTFRPPYGRHVQEFRRTCIINGTTNERGWHSDNTGGRRFWPIVTPESIDLEWLRTNRTQLFAEAYALYRAGPDRGGKWWDVPEEEQARRIEEERHVDPWEEILSQRLADPSLFDGHNGQRRLAGDGGTTETADFGTMVTTTRIAVQWLRLTPEQMSRHGRKLADVMRTLGWEKARGRAEDRPHPLMYWMATEPRPEGVPLHGPSDVSARPDDDIPF